MKRLFDMTENTDNNNINESDNGEVRKKHSPWKVVYIILGALALLIGISFLPLSKMTGGWLSDINLFSDILNIGQPEEKDMPGAYVDPCLAEAINEAAAEPDTRAVDTTMTVERNEVPVLAVQPNRVDGEVVIEDYTEAGRGLKRLRDAITSGRMGRIAVIGDSYIEGDIFSEDLREMLQNSYGGSGVGYINMHSEFPGFRRSVKQGGGEGWKEFAANGKHDSDYMGLAQHYYKLSSPTASTYSGSSSFSHVDKWNESKFLFIAPQSTVIKTRTSGGDWVEHQVEGSPDVQCITVDGETSKFDVSVSDNSVIGLGVWLTDKTGVNVDCMSSRGFSGVTLRKISPELASQMRKFIDYDLIILEFGINAMSAKQTNYDGYAKSMINVVEHVRQCYPNSDIMIMGIGDRGSKRGTEVHSMSAAPHMVSAQRDMARKAHCLFWDTRESMGGEDAIVRWVRDGLANKDYIHLNHKGGRKLAEPLSNAIRQNLDK